MAIDILVGLVGLAIGSFLNVCIYRLPIEESVIYPWSYCPECEKTIRWYDNIPVLSFVLLSGKCRDCRTRISFRYPLVELVSAALWVGLWKVHGWSPVFPITGTFVSLLLVAALADLETGLIPDTVTLLGLAVGLNVSFFYSELHQTTSSLLGVQKGLTGMVLGGVLIYGTGLAGNWIFQKELTRLKLNESMGGGDVKLLAMIGTFLGWEKVLLTFFTAPLLALPFALYSRWVKNEAVVPYGPFLSLAALLYLLWGDWIWRFLIFGGYTP